VSLERVLLSTLVVLVDGSVRLLDSVVSSGICPPPFPASALMVMSNAAELVVSLSRRGVVAALSEAPMTPGRVTDAGSDAETAVAGTVDTLVARVGKLLLLVLFLLPDVTTTGRSTAGAGVCGNAGSAIRGVGDESVCCRVTRSSREPRPSSDTTSAPGEGDGWAVGRVVTAGMAGGKTVESSGCAGRIAIECVELDTVTGLGCKFCAGLVIPTRAAVCVSWRTVAVCVTLDSSTTVSTLTPVPAVDTPSLLLVDPCGTVEVW
jgi:hypothetical protein